MHNNSIWRFLLIVIPLLSGCTQTALEPASYPATAAHTPTPLQPSQEPSTQTPEPTLTPIPTATTIEKHPVIVIAWDGISPDEINSLMEGGYLPTFSEVIRRGIQADYMTSVNPPLTAPAQSSLVSGAQPGTTGIVANQYHAPVDNFYWYRQAFDEPIQKSEPVWVIASRLGYLTAALFMAGENPSNMSQAADLTIGYGIRDAYSSQQELRLSEATGWVGAPETFSPPLETSYFIPSVARVHFLIYDSSDDGQSNYDKVLVGLSKNGYESKPAVSMGERQHLELNPVSHAGAYFKVQEIRSDQIVIYHSGVYHNTALPRSLLEGLNEQFGWFIAGADAYALEQGWIDENEYLYQLREQSHWMAEVTRWVQLSYQPDLMFSGQDVFDSAGHAFYLRQSNQVNYSSERADQFLTYYQEAAIVANEALRIMIEPVDLDNTTLLMVSDHGMAPVHTTIYLNTLLERSGMLVLDRRDYVVEAKTKALAVASGGVANIYINLKGRDPIGTVRSDEYSQIQDKIITQLQTVVDPSTGAPVFSRVLRRQELASIGLDHPHSGDIWVQANPGYHIDGWRGKLSVFEPTKFYGQHGYDNRLADMRAVLFAAGYHVNSVVPNIGPVSILDVAPTICKWLHLPVNEWMIGQPLPIDSH